jgi:TM2 domain-containing membrane protein YozV
VITLALLYFLGGGIGLHQFYTDRLITGVLYVCTMAVFGVGLIYDGILMVFGKFETS